MSVPNRIYRDSTKARAFIPPPNKIPQRRTIWRSTPGNKFTPGNRQIKLEPLDDSDFALTFPPDEWHRTSQGDVIITVEQPEWVDYPSSCFDAYDIRPSGSLRLVRVVFADELGDGGFESADEYDLS